ncbi:PQQ-binding-like beta-propeller repeat protein [candidate division GN15 bacterium]|nr:PQQ-binding-like beta-propeller repeat protein [candidate division GN15 bacterium]
MLKRLIIAVFVLSLVMALSGTAISDTGKGPLNEVIKVNPLHQRFDAVSDARPVQPSFKKPASAIQELPSEHQVTPAPPAPSFCEYQGYYGDLAYYWTIPDAYGDDLFNMRFTVEDDLESCTLLAGWLLMYGPAQVGTPDMRVYLWDTDGFGFPNNKLDSVDVSTAGYDPAGSYWVMADFDTDWVFTTGEEYHIGWTNLGGPSDVLAILSDDGLGPAAGEERSSEFYAGAWGTMLNDWGDDVAFVIEAERCCVELPISDCDYETYYRNITYYLSAPHPVYGDTAYAQRIEVGSSDTLKYVDVYVHDPVDGSFGNDDVYVSIYDDNAGLPGNLLVSKTLAAGTYAAYPTANFVDFAADNLVFEDGNEFHVVLSTSGTVDYESFLFSDGTDGVGRSSSIWPGQPWTPLLTGWGFDGNLVVDPFLCVDPFSDCFYGNNCFTGPGYFWRLPDAYGSDANAQFMQGSGIECRVEQVEWFLYDNGTPNAYTTNSEVSIWTDAGGLPGAKLAGVTLEPADYVLYPGVQTVDFTSLDVFVSGGYWVVIESFGTDTTDGIRTLSDAGGGGCTNNAAERYLGTWGYMCDGWNVPCDIAFGADVYMCCMPFPDCQCGLAEDFWAPGGDYARQSNSDVSLSDAHCDLNLSWAYEHPTQGMGLYSGPVISGTGIVSNFTDQYQRQSILDGSVVWNFTDGDLGDNLRCTPTVTTIDIGGTPTEVVFVGGGNQQSIFCLDNATGAIIWERSFSTIGADAIQGITQYPSFVVLEQAGREILYWGTQSGKIQAVEAATGTLWTPTNFPGEGWATNPVNLGATVGVSGATDGVRLFFATQPAGPGDVYAVNAATGAIDWQLSTFGLQAGNVYPGVVGFENFWSGVSYYNDTNGGEVYVNATMNSPAFPEDGVFYRLDATTGEPLSASQSQRTLWNHPVMDCNRVYLGCFSNWISPPLGNNLLAYTRLNGALDWVSGAQGGDSYRATGILTCEPDSAEWLFIFSEDGFLSAFDSRTGDEVFRRRIDRPSGGADIGGGIALSDEGEMAIGTFWGDLFLLEKGADRPRLEFLSYNASVGLNFGTGAVNVDFGPMFHNPGCMDLSFSAVNVDENSFTQPIPAFSAPDYTADELLLRAEFIADRVAKDHFLRKFSRVASFTDDLGDPRELNTRTELYNRAASAVPVWLNGVVSPGVGQTVPAGDTINLVLDVQNELINRGPNVVYLQLETNDPDFFLNDVTSAPQMKATIVGGCLLDTTYLNFGMGAANYQVVYNTGRIGYQPEGEDDVYSFGIDGVTAAYYGGSYLWGVSERRLAMNSPDWTGGTTDEVISMQGDPNWCDNDCKPFLQTGVSLGEYSTDGLTYTTITGDYVCKSFIDSVQNFDTDGDPLTDDWDWTNFGAPFDNDSTMGLKANTKTIGAVDFAPLANVTLEILDIFNRNNNDVPDWYMGEYIDYDVGSSDTIAIDRSNSVAYGYSPGADGVWGAVKVPFGCGYEPLLNVKGLIGDQALWDWNAYFDSAYTYLTNAPGHYSQNTSAGDFEAHFTYASHDFGPTTSTDTSRFILGVAHFGLTNVVGDAATPTEVAELAQLVNKWAGFGRGDVNDDGMINLADITYLAYYVMDDATNPGPIPFKHLGDVNNDGDINSADVDLLVTFYFECGACPVGDWEL